TESREAEDAIAIGLDQSLQKSTRFRKRVRAEYCFHWNFEQAVRNMLRFGFVFIQSNAGQFRIREQAVRYLPARSRMVNSNQVVMHHAEIVNADVCELWAARNLADCPNAGRGGLQPLIDLDVSPVGELDASNLQAKSFGVRMAACGDQYMTTL